MNLTIDPLAELELIEAAARYEQIRTGLGDEFLDAVEHAFELIAANPRSHAVLEYWKVPGHDVRRCCLRRFPYIIIFWVRDLSLTILAVSHSRRQPLYWIERIGT